MELGVPAPIAINEATNLAKEYTCPKSARFVNGVLGRLVKENPGLLGDGKKEKEDEEKKTKASPGKLS